MILVCRPPDSVSYAVQYYYDEKCSNPAVNHAIHSLLYLLRQPVDFRSAIGTIYCAETAANASAPVLGKEQMANEGSKEAKEGDGAQKVEKNVDDRSTANESCRETPVPAENEPTLSSDDAVTEAVKHLNKLCRIARLAIASYDASLAVAAGNGKSDLLKNLLEPIPGTEDKEWLFELIEKSLRKDPISEAVTLDFETYISFLRLYLGLWTVVAWLERATTSLKAMKSNNAKIDVLIKDMLTLGSNPRDNEDSLLISMMLEEDEDVLRRLLAGVYNTCTPDEKEDIEKVVTRSFEQYFGVVMSSTN